MRRSECLRPTELAAFHLGDLPEAELAELAEHLEGCSRCDEAARALDGLSDPTLAAYRQSAIAGPLPEGDSLPEQVGDYEILAEIGRGGMGVVYRARHVRLHRVVALKMLLAGYFADRSQRDRFRAEAEAVARLQHPQIVQLFEIGEHVVDAGLARPYFTLELVEGGSLEPRLAGRPLPQQQAAGWVELLARAVHYAHEQGIIHRDLKPSNILLTKDGQPKICDFGVAKLLTGSELKTLSGTVLGTAEYMAPEQAEGNAIPGPASDVYALGAILYEMLAGRPPFKGANTLDTLNQVRTQEPVPIRRLQPLVARDLETIALKCLEKEPAKRYTTAAALAEDLRRFLAKEPIVARAIRWSGRAIKWGRRRPAVALLGAAVAAAILLGLTGMAWQWQRALTERTRAIRLADDLRTQRDAAEWQTYRANIGAATTALELHNYDSVQRYLAAAPVQHRNWEWAHLSSLLDPSYSALRGHTNEVRDLAFSPDGGQIASASDDQTVRLWDVATGSQIAVLESHEMKASLVNYSPDGQRLGSTYDNLVARLWDRTTGALVAELPGKLDDVTRLTFSPDSRFVAAPGQEEGVVYVWDAETGKSRYTLRHRSGISGPLAFASGGKRLFGACSAGTITAWDMESGEMVMTWQGHSAGMTALSISPDGRCLASGGDFPDNAVRLWDTDSGREMGTLLGHKNQINHLVFSPDGLRLVSASWDQTARLWDRSTGQTLAVLQHRGRVTCAAFRPDDEQLVTRGDDQVLRLWDAKTGEPFAILSAGSPISNRGVRFSPDGRLLACPSANKVLLWDVGLLKRNGVLSGHTGYVYDVAFSPDGTQIASAAWDGTVRVWDAISQGKGNPLEHDDRIVVSLAFAADGKKLVSAVKGPSFPTHGGIYVWDLGTGRREYTRRASREVLEDTRVAVNQDASLVALATHGASAEIFDLTADTTRVLGEADGSSSDVAFKPHSLELATAEQNGTVRLWNVATGAQVDVLRGHQASVQCVCYSPDRKLIASSSLDFTVRLWDAKTHMQVAILPHGCIVYGLAFSPDCTRLATACRDNTIRLWDVATHDEVAELRGHADYVHAVAFSPDGTQLASASGDYTVRIWDTVPVQVRARTAINKSRRAGEQVSR